MIPPSALWSVVLHAHLPFVRHPEHEHFLEEDWLYEAITETYVPLLRMMDRLDRDAVPFRITLTISPTLATMLRDPLLLRRYEKRLRALAKAAIAETKRAPAAFQAALRFQIEELEDVRRRFVSVYDADLLAAFVRHRDKGSLEIMTCGATHGFLPLLRVVEECVRAQVDTAAREHRRVFGRDAAGIWLPECAYYPGVERFLLEAGLRYSILETHGLTHAEPRPSYGTSAPILSPGGVAFFARDRESSEQVWSSIRGYPGDPAYREFYRDLGYELPMADLADLLSPGDPRRQVGLKIHRITGAIDLHRKDPYDRAAALGRARAHAAHFVEQLVARTARLGASMPRPPHVLSPYDAELFGHWWFEGPDFLEAVFRGLAASPVAAVTPSEYFQRYDECEVAQPPLSTWGANGYAEVWLNESNDWVYPHLEHAGRRMVSLARRFGHETGVVLQALKQAARELLLAQASDWPFIMKTGTVVGYARGRVVRHLNDFSALADEIERGRVNAKRLRTLEQRNAIFPEIDPGVFVHGRTDAARPA